MSDYQPSSRRRSRNIDIAKSPLIAALRPKMPWVWFLVFALALMLFMLGESHLDISWVAVPLVGLVVLVFAGLVAWKLIVRRGVLTWMRLAWAPAKAMARGEPAEAERLFQRALQRAWRFHPEDHRRGLMLVELAGYAKNQGRYPEARDLFEEAVDILGRHRRANPVDYFVALNNYAIYFIHLRDHAAAQRLLERVLDLTLVGTKGQSDKVTIAPAAIGGLELVLHLNLIFLFVEMGELSEARGHLEEAADLFHTSKPRRQARLGDHYRAIRALLMYAQGQFANAESELNKARNPTYSACLRVRARLALVRQDFPQAEQLLRQYLDLERKKGTLHRPELRDHFLDLAESLFGQAKHDEAYQALQESRTIVADFALPAGPHWRRAVEGWLKRARDQGRAEVAASLSAELERISATPEHGIIISDRLRVRPPP